MNTRWIAAMLVAAPALAGCVKYPEVVIDSTSSDHRLYLLAVRQDGNTQSRKVVRCDRAADGSLGNCAEVPLILEGKEP